MASAQDSIAIDRLFTDKGRAIKRAGNNDEKFDNVGIVNANKKSMAKFKD